MGWNLLSEFGSLSPSRFGGYQINTVAGFLEDSWQVIPGYSAANTVNWYDYGVSNESLQWFGGSGDGIAGRSGYQKSIPQYTQRVLVAWGGFGARTCTMKILNADDVQLIMIDHNTAGLPMSANLRLDEVNVDFSNGKGKISFEEYGYGICWTF